MATLCVFFGYSKAPIWNSSENEMIKKNVMANKLVNESLFITFHVPYKLLGGKLVSTIGQLPMVTKLANSKWVRRVRVSILFAQLFLILYTMFGFVTSLECLLCRKYSSKTQLAELNIALEWKWNFSHGIASSHVRLVFNILS